jgi:ArsR family metal-binding transcriptional regulator
MGPIDIAYESLNFSKAYETLSLFPIGPMGGSGTAPPGSRTRGARFRLDWDLSPLFPLINAVVPDARLYETPCYIKFQLNAHLCAFHPHEGVFSPVKDYTEARTFLDDLVAFIQNLFARKAEIVPNHRKFNPVSALDIFQLLPRSNCRACGQATCMAFAAAVSRQKSSPAECPHLGQPVEEKAHFPVLDAQGRLIRTVALEIEDRKSTRLNSSHNSESRMPSSA